MQIARKEIKTDWIKTHTLRYDQSFQKIFSRRSKTLDDPLDNFPVYAVFINQYYWENTIQKVNLDP